MTQPRADPSRRQATVARALVQDALRAGGFSAAVTAKARLCQRPASSRDSSLQFRSAARPRAVVVRSSVASCSRKGTSSALSFTSHSKAR